MSQKKTTPIENHKRAVTAKRNDAVQNPGAAPGESGGHWTQSLEPNGSAFLSQMLGPAWFVVKNHGPDRIMLIAHQGDEMDLSPGTVRATYARDTITVKNTGKRRTWIEFEFIPIYLKL